MNKKIYVSAMDNLSFHDDFEDRLLANLKAGKQQKLKVTAGQMPKMVQRAAEYAGIAACLVIVALLYFTVFQNGHIKLPNASGSVSVRVVKNPDLDYQAIPQPKAMTEQERLLQADTIFSGTVEKTETLEIELGQEVSYRSLITVKTDYVWCGSTYAGDEVKILLPYAIDEQNSNPDADLVLAQIRTGIRGIFLASRYTEQSTVSNDDNTLALMDVAPYGLTDDWCAFIKKDDVMVYHQEAFPGLKENPTFDDVKAYITELLKTVPTRQTTGTDGTNETGGTVETNESGNVLTDPSFGANKSTDSETGTSNELETSKEIETGNEVTTATVSKSSEYDGPPASDFDFINDQSARSTNIIYKIAKDGSKEIFNAPDHCTLIQPYGDWVYYLKSVNPASDTDGIYRCRPDGSESTLIYRCKDCWAFTIAEDNFIVQTINNTFYRMNMDGGNVRELCTLSNGGVPIALINDDNYLYFLQNNDLVRVSLTDGSSMEIHQWENVDGLCIDTAENGWVYYTEVNNQAETSIKRIRTDGTDETTLVTSGDIKDMLVFNGYLYYIDDTKDPQTLYRLPLDSADEPLPIVISHPNASESFYPIILYKTQSHMYVLCLKDSCMYDLYRMNEEGTDGKLLFDVPI